MWKPNPADIVTAEMKAVADREATKLMFEQAIQAMVDNKPKERDFRDGVTIASYSASTNPVWSAQASAFIAWRDQVWAYAYAELEKALTGQRNIPTVDEFLSELPALIWPD